MSAPEAALAYALWDSRHSEKLTHPDDVEAHLAEAREVMRWLRIHGAHVRMSKRGLKKSR